MKVIAALACILAMTGAAQAEPGYKRLPRGDSSEIAYHLDRGGGGRRQGLLLMLHGSGCDPVIEREWLRSEPEQLAPGWAVLAIEKYGVDSARPVHQEEGCSPDYWHKNNLQQRVLDAIRVVASLRQENWWNGELLIHGGSEGGAVAAMLAPLLPETKGVILQSAGLGVTIGALIQAAVPPPVAIEMRRVFAEAKANPTGNRRFGGASYQWWASAVDIVPAASLLQTRVPILLIHGGLDRLAPVSSARATRELFARAGKATLTYVEYADYDHAMKDAAGRDHRREVLAHARRWLRSSGIIRQSGKGGSRRNGR